MRRGNYAPRACNHCRRRKTRCDGVQPECARCRTSGHECSWGPESARKPTTKHYVTSLQNMVEVLKRKNESLEAQLALYKREINQQHPDSSNSSPLSVMGPLSDIDSPDRQPAALEDDVVKQEEDPDPVEQLIAPTEHLHFEGDNIRLYGPTSIFRLAPRDQAPEHTSRFQQIAESQSGSYRLWYRDGSPQADIDWKRHLPQDVPLSRAEHDRILDLLFRFFTSWCLRVVPELFLHDMCRSLSTPIGQMPPKTPHYSPMLHNALLSVATAFSDDPEIKKLEARRKFSTKAKDRLEEECERPNLSVICALSVLSNFHSSQGEQTLGYMYFGISARMSQALGLGFDCSPWVAKGLISEDTMHDRNFAYWTTFCQDTTWSLYVGRDFCLPSQTDRQRVRVPFVDSQLDHFNWDWPGQSLRPNYIPRTFAATCDLMQVARQILDVVSNFSRLSIYQRVDDYLIGQMDLKLHTWKNNLAPEVDINKLTFATAMPHQLMLQMTYHWLGIILHRPFYRRKRSTDEKAFEVDHMKLCDRAAHEIMELATKWRELYSLRYVPITFIQVVSAAGTIFVLSALQAVSGTRLAKAAHHHARANVEKTIQYLHEVGESFPSARAIGEILANLLREQLEARLARRAGMPQQLASLSPGGGELLQELSPSGSMSMTSLTEEISPRSDLMPTVGTQEPIMRQAFSLHSADASFLAYGISSFNNSQASTSFSIDPFSDQSQFLSGDIDMGPQNLLGAEMWMDGGNTFSNVPFMSGSPSNSPPQPAYGHNFSSEEVMLDMMSGPGVYNF